MVLLQNLQKFRVRVRKCYRTHRSSGYCGTGVQNSQKFRAGIKMLYPYPGYLWYERKELTEVPGTGISVVQNLQKFRVRVLVSYRTYRSSGYGYECPTELTEVLCRGMPGINTPGMVLYVPYRTHPWKFPWKLRWKLLPWKLPWKIRTGPISGEVVEASV